MKRIFGIALLALPLMVGSIHAEGYPFCFQAGGTFYMRGSNCAMPQAGPWYLYWPLEAHFVAPAPTGYPYWPPPQGLPATTFGGPAVPPPPAYLAPPPAAVVPPYAVAPPAVSTTPAPVAPVPQLAPRAPQPTTPRVQLPPYLQPTSYYPRVTSGQPPSYWYDR